MPLELVIPNLTIRVIGETDLPLSAAWLEGDLTISPGQGMAERELRINNPNDSDVLVTVSMDSSASFAQVTYQNELVVPSNGLYDILVSFGFTDATHGDIAIIQSTAGVGLSS